MRNKSADRRQRDSISTDISLGRKVKYKIACNAKYYRYGTILCCQAGKHEEAPAPFQAFLPKIKSETYRSHKGVLACISGRASEVFLNAHQLVIFFNPLTPGRCAGLEVTGIQGHGHIGDKAVHGLSAAV